MHKLSSATSRKPSRLFASRHYKNKWMMMICCAQRLSGIPVFHFMFCNFCFDAIITMNWHKYREWHLKYLTESQVMCCAPGQRNETGCAVWRNRKNLYILMHNRAGGNEVFSSHSWPLAPMSLGTIPKRPSHISALLAVAFAYKIHNSDSHSIAAIWVFGYLQH